jgi:hypothetical protein
VITAQKASNPKTRFPVSATFNMGIHLFQGVVDVFVIVSFNIGNIEDKV